MFELIARKSANLKDDLLSGLTVALALVPEAVAFSFVAGVDPLVGLYAAFMVGLITAIAGGRPGMISGATGALAVVMVSLVADHGVEYLFAAVVLMGILQIGAGVLRLGKFVRLIPHPVMLGFVNGLAIVIFLAQLGQFKFADEAGIQQWLQGPQLYLMLGLVLLTMAIIHFLPKLTRAIPSSLAAIVVVTGIAHGLNLDTRMVGDLASVAGGLPQFHIPMVPLSLENLLIILPYSVILAAIGLIESLLTMTLVDELTETRGRGNKECIGQGLANVVTGFFGGMGGCAMIGQSIINISSGGRGRLSGITAALCLLAFIVLASGLIEMVPLAALVGGDVHGGGRHLRLVKLTHPAQGSAQRCAGVDSGLRGDSGFRSGDCGGRRGDRLGAGFCLGKRQADRFAQQCRRAGGKSLSFKRATFLRLNQQFLRPVHTAG